MKELLPATASPLMRSIERTALRARDLVASKSIIGMDLSRIYNLEAYLQDPELEPMLPFLAWSLQIPVWRDEWTTQQKVDFIRIWLRCKARSGTKGSILDAVAALGLRVDLLDDGPFAFKIRITDSIETEDRDAIKRVVDELKPLRCRSRLEIITSFVARLGILGTLSTVKIKRIADMAIFSQVLTDLGQQVVFGSGGESGVAYQFTKVEFGSERYSPDRSQRQLRTKIGEVTVVDTKNFSRPGPGAGSRLFGTNITAKIPAEGGFDIGEIGVWISANGRDALFGVVSSPDVFISKKIEGEELLLSIDIFTTRELSDIAIVGTGERLNLSVDDQFAQLAEENIELRSQIQALEQTIFQQTSVIETLDSRLRLLEGRS